MLQSRTILLAASLLSACAASGPNSVAGYRPSGVYGDFLVGRFAASQNEIDLAADSFLKALRLDPGNPALLQQAFVACVLAGRPEAARLARQLPDNQAAQMLLGNLDAEAGNWGGALRRYRALPQHGLTQVLQPLLVAWAELGDGQPDAALATLQPLVDDPRGRGVYALHAAMIADIAGRDAEAARYYKMAEDAADPRNLRLTQIVASWQLRQGHPGEAQATIRGFLAGSPDLAVALPALLAADRSRPVAKPTDGIAEAYLTLASALRAQSADELALLLLRMSLDLRPDLTPARLLMAEIEDQSRRRHAALDTLNTIPAGDPLHAVAQLRRADLLSETGDVAGAEKVLQGLAHASPTRAEPLIALGDLYRSRRRYAQAIAAYDQALARIPHPGAEDWALFYSRGIAYEHANDWPRAEADLLHALTLSPDQPYVLNYLGYAWTEQGRNLPRARQMIERAVSLRPNDGSLIDSLGWVELRMGDAPAAIRDLQRAVELDPEDPVINGHLGDAYASAGRRLEADYQWQRALSLHPEPGDAARLEAKLHEAGGAMPTAASATVPPGSQQGAAVERRTP